MSKQKLFAIIVAAVQAILLQLCGYTVESAEFWIAFIIVMLEYWHSYREWTLEQHWIGFGVQLFTIFLWAVLILRFDIKLPVFFVIMISGVIVSFCGLHQKRLKRKGELSLWKN